MSYHDPGPAITLPGRGDPARRNPVRLLLSGAPWKAAAFLAGYVLISGVLAAIALAAAGTGAVLAITLIGVPVMVVVSGAVQFAAGVERARLRPVLAAPLRSGYRQPAKPGVFAAARTRWTDPATWRDLAYLIGLWAPLLALDFAVLLVWVSLISLVVVPAWYYFPEQDLAHGATAHGVQLGYFPNGPHGPGGYGFYITTLPQAFLAAACALIAFLLFNYVLVATARAHVVVARNLLRPPADPLADAKTVLAGPSPLGPLQPH
jgi:Putative sensor